MISALARPAGAQRPPRGGVREGRLQAWRAKRHLDAAICAARKEVAEKSRGVAVTIPHWTVHDLRTTFSTQACDTLEIDIAVVDGILNHVATATTSKIMRVYNKSEPFEPRKRALAEWAKLIERLVAEQICIEQLGDAPP